MSQPASTVYLPKARVEAFSDAVIAIIMTLLVIEIKVPKLYEPDVPGQLAMAMAHALPLVGAYAMSFVVLLVFWVSHHQLLHSMQKVDRPFLWLNGLFLMVLAFVPVPTALVGEYPQAPGGSVLYGSVMALAGLCFFAIRVYATHHAQLLHESIPADVSRKALRKGLLSPLLYGLGALISTVFPPLAWAVFVIVPFIYIVPSSFDRAAPAPDRT